MPALRFSLNHPPVPKAVALAMFIVTAGMIRGGVVPSILFPKADNNNIQATISFPDGTTAAETDKATRDDGRSASSGQQGGCRRTGCQRRGFDGEHLPAHRSQH